MQAINLHAILHQSSIFIYVIESLSFVLFFSVKSWQPHFHLWGGGGTLASLGCSITHVSRFLLPNIETGHVVVVVWHISLKEGSQFRSFLHMTVVETDWTARSVICAGVLDMLVVCICSQN